MKTKPYPYHNVMQVAAGDLPEPAQAKGPEAAKNCPEPATRNSQPEPRTYESAGISPGQRLQEINIPSLILLTTVEFCKALNISERSALEWRRAGIIPYLRIHGRIYYRLSDILEAMDKLTLRNQPKNL